MPRGSMRDVHVLTVAQEPRTWIVLRKGRQFTSPNVDQDHMTSRDMMRGDREGRPVHLFDYDGILKYSLGTFLTNTSNANGKPDLLHIARFLPGDILPHASLVFDDRNLQTGVFALPLDKNKRSPASVFSKEQLRQLGDPDFPTFVPLENLPKVLPKPALVIVQSCLISCISEDDVDLRPFLHAQRKAPIPSLILPPHLSAPEQVLSHHHVLSPWSPSLNDDPKVTWKNGILRKVLNGMSYPRHSLSTFSYPQTADNIGVRNYPTFAPPEGLRLVTLQPIQPSQEKPVFEKALEKRFR